MNQHIKQHFRAVTLLILFLAGWAACPPAVAQEELTLNLMPEPGTNLVGTEKVAEGSGSLIIQPLETWTDPATGISLSFSTADGTTAPAYYASTGDVRLYGKNTFKLHVPAAYAVTSITFENTLTSAPSNAISASAGYIESYAGETGAYVFQWTNEELESDVTFTNTSTKQVRLSSLTISAVTTGEAEKPKAPTLSTRSCTFYEPFQLSMVDSNSPACEIYYTLDGSDPVTNGTLYSEPITIPAGADVTVKAVCMKDGKASTVASATYSYQERHQVIFETNSKSALGSAYIYAGNVSESLLSGKKIMVAPGENVSLEYYLNSNYKITELSVNGTKVNSSNYYSFTMPGSDVTVRLLTEYDPSSPGDPQPGEKLYKLTLVSNPAGGCSVYGSGKYKEGESVYVNSYNNSGYKFLNWTRDGESISVSSSFRFTMPASDVILTANYVYAPTSPSDPEEPKLLHPVTVVAEPAGAASFYTSGTEVATGDSYTVYAYPNQGYRLTGWVLNGVPQETANSSFTGVMTDEGAALKATFVYNPSTPDEPFTNSYNPSTGLLIMDHFTPGNLSSAISAVTNNNSNGVTHIIVKGSLLASDRSAITNLTNALVVDLSRTSGLNEANYSTYGNMGASTLILPACTNKINSQGLYGWSNLSTLECYAMVPPKVDSYSLSYLDKDRCVVRVPAEAISLYEDADYWKDFTIMPLSADLHTLVVNLPTDCADGRYKNNRIELVNTATGSRQKYVVTDRPLYTFINLQKDDQYNVYMTSQAGLEIGRIEGILIPASDTEVTFSNLKALHTVTATVTTAEGENVTEQVSVEWSKPLADGTEVYLRKASSLGEVPEGQKLICRVTLDSKLGVAYATPEDVKFTVTGSDNSCAVVLRPLGSVKFTGRVADADGMPISGASVSMSQTLNGKYTKTATAKTDKNGNWDLEAFNAPGTVFTFSAPECVNLNLPVEVIEGSLMDLGQIKLRSIVGARVTYGFSYRAAGAAAADSHFDDYRNVLFSVFNKTQQRAHSDLSTQYPVLAVLDENISAGDELTLTLSSKTGAFRPMEKTVTVGEDGRAEVTFDIVGKGGISASYEATDNPGVTAMLYSPEGELLMKTSYEEANATFSELEEGDYTLVTMGASDLMNSILRLSAFEEIGLAEGRDYVKNEVKVSDGLLSEVRISDVPALDESLFFYTTEASGFSSNKSSLTTGNYLTLRAAIDFKGVYKNDVSNVNLVVDLPANCDFVTQSVIQGKELRPYALDDHRLSISLGDRYDTQTRFCVVPLSGGRFNATAAVVFDYNGKTLTQPLGSAVSEVKDIEINVPAVIASAEFTVSGKAASKSDVDVYSGNTLIGRTTANGAGVWSAACALTDPRNAETYPVEARIATTEGSVLHSESKEVTYDNDAVAPTEVTMTFLNGWNHKQYTVIWNLVDATCNASSYDFYTGTDLTFLVKFNTENPETVRNIVINVFTNDNKVTRLVPVFDAKSRSWMAKQYFSSSSLPTNVSVDFEKAAPIKIDSRFLAENLDASESIRDNYLEDCENLNALCESFLASDDDTVLDDMFEALGIMPESDSDDISEESIASHLESIPDNQATYIDELLKASPFSSDIAEYMEGVSVTTCDGLGSEEEILEAGFSEILKSDGTKAFYLSSETEWKFADPANNICLTVDLTSGGNMAKAMLANARDDDGSGSEWIDRLEELSGQIKDLVGNIKDFLDSCSDNLDDALKSAENELKELYNERRWLKQNSNNAFLKGEIKLRIAAQTKVVDGIKKTSHWLKHNFSQYMSGGGKIAGKAFSFSALILDGIEAVKEVSALIELRNSLIAPCEKAEAANQKLVSSVNRWIAGAGAYYVGKLGCDIAEIGGVTAGLAALIPSGGTSVSAILASIAIMAGNIAADYAYKKFVGDYKNRTRSAYRKLQELCKKKNPKPEDFPDDPGDPDFNDPTDNSNTSPTHYPDPADPVTPYTTPIHDPSGYVYEAVPENRVEGVQASIYYKETKEDMYGDPYEEVVLWNAEEYAQRNPLFTDENGMYQWDVPQGLWQVKFEKDGYQTAYSEWLPVPPPQLEVNIGIVQNKQPEVTEARAYEEGVEVQFDKYMDPATLTTSNIYVSANGTKLDGEIRLVDSALADEFADEEDADATRYASRVRFVPVEKLSGTTGEIRVTVSRDVLSYAGIPMTETFTQALDVEKEVQTIYADDVKVLYGGEKEVTVYALPYEAAVGRRLHIANSSEIIASVDVTEATLDDEGKAVVKVKGDLPGRAQLTFTIDDVTATGDCAVDVVTEIITAEAPKASRASGTAVYRGTKVELTTDSKDATIYFTTDGSCPCDADGTRRKYTVPIVIGEDTKILAMTSVGNNGNDVSETVEFNYTLRRSNMDFRMDQGWTWMSHNFETAIEPSALAEGEEISRVLTQTQEVVRDPQLGLVGTLRELSAEESFKVETSASAVSPRLSDYAWNPSTPIALGAGWNWLGYPVSQTMSVNEALAPTDAETEDVIVGQNGFAQFDGEKWVGTLETMTPGAGYMYQSRSAKNVVYNTSIVSMAAAKFAAGISADQGLAIDIRKYASVMPVVATLHGKTGAQLDNEDYRVAAFSGTECRGIGRTVNGLVMMSVYGDPGDRITFRVTDADGDVSYENGAAIDFAEDVKGSLFSPYVIALNAHTGVRENALDGDIRVFVEKDLLVIKGADAKDIELVEVYDTDGSKLIRETSVPESGIRTSALVSGVYVVIVKANGEFSYHKIAIRQ